MRIRNLFLPFVALALLGHASPVFSVISTDVALNRIGRKSPLAKLYTTAMTSYHHATQPPKNVGKLQQAELKLRECINDLLINSTHDPRTKEAHESLLQNLLDKHTEIQETLPSTTPPIQTRRRISLRRRPTVHVVAPPPAPPAAPAHLTPRPALLPNPTRTAPRHTLEEWETYDPEDLIDVPRPSEQHSVWHHYNPDVVRNTVLTALERDARRMRRRRTPPPAPQTRPQITPDADGWQTYDEAQWDGVPSHGARTPRQPQGPQTVAERWAQDARAAINLRPQAAEGANFDFFEKPVDSQNGIDCGFHTVYNGHAIVQALVKMPLLSNIAQTLQSLPMPPRATIQAAKRAFDRGQDLHRCLDLTELTAFIDFHLRRNPIKNHGGHIIQPYENKQNHNFYWTNLEYIQASKDRDVITHAINFLNFIRQRTGDINRAKQILYRTGRLQWPDVEPGGFSDPGITIAQFNNLRMYQQLIRGYHSQYLTAIKEFRNGKTLVTSFLDHPGNGHGHWSCKVFIPCKRHVNSPQPDYVNVINIDSGIRGNLSADARRFIFDLLHLELPNHAHLYDINRILSADRI